MTDQPRPPKHYELEWQDALRFSARVDGVSLVLDSRAEAGPSPMDAVAFGLAGCMAIDVVNILDRSRVRLSGVRATLDAHRGTGQPARFVRMDLHFDVTGPEVPPDRVERAIELSRDKYCSVWHSLRQDIDLRTTFTIHSQE